MFLILASFTTVFLLTRAIEMQAVCWLTVDLAVPFLVCVCHCCSPYLYRRKHLCLGELRDIRHIISASAENNQPFPSTAFQPLRVSLLY